MPIDLDEDPRRCRLDDCQRWQRCQDWQAGDIPRARRTFARDLYCSAVGKVISISDLRRRARELVDQIAEDEQPVVITRRGRAAAVLVSYGTFAGLVATWAEMSFPDWKRRLRRARQESRRGTRVSLDAYVKRRAHRRGSPPHTRISTRSTSR